MFVTKKKLEQELAFHRVCNKDIHDRIDTLSNRLSELVEALDMEFAYVPCQPEVKSRVIVRKKNKEKKRGTA